MKKLIAITGGIGSGKSFVLNHLNQMGYPTFSCDEIYREIILSPTYIQKISAVFPECITEGKINRKLLAKEVFNDKQKLELLNGISHPLIMDHLLNKMKDSDNHLVFAEVPLLFEGNFERQFDFVIVVLRNKEERIRSIMLRDKITKEEALNRMDSQFDYENGDLRFKNCNAILIENIGSTDDLKLKIEDAVKQFM